MRVYFLGIPRSSIASTKEEDVDILDCAANQSQRAPGTTKTIAASVVAQHACRKFNHIAHRMDKIYGPFVLSS